VPELSFVTHIARTVYGLEPQSVAALAPYCSEQRGIYRVQDTQDGVWMFRLLRRVYLSASLCHAGQLLAWLTQQQYPAPAVRRTTDQQWIGLVDDWAIIVLAYVDGTPLGTHPTDLVALAQMVGWLHTVQVDRHRAWATSRNHSETITTAAQQLATHRDKVPEAFRALVINLHADMITLQRQSAPHLQITHGDCWHMNAIKTRDGGIILIDWDHAGLGLPLLDLGNLLLTSHFDMSQPLHVEADEQKIQAIVHGYQQSSSIDIQDSEYVANTMRFLLAWQLGSYLADGTLVLHPDFPFVLQKLQARYDATRDIADRAVHSIR
jgi:aminoglycoside phosphotransferase (APT) family kinase protein